MESRNNIVFPNVHTYLFGPDRLSERSCKFSWKRIPNDGFLLAWKGSSQRRLANKRSIFQWTNLAIAIELPPRLLSDSIWVKSGTGSWLHLSRWTSEREAVIAIRKLRVNPKRLNSRHKLVNQNLSSLGTAHFSPGNVHKRSSRWRLRGKKLYDGEKKDINSE